MKRIGLLRLLGFNRDWLRALVAALMVCATAPAFAACPIELAVYGDARSSSGIDFRPTTDSATVTNTFKMVLDNGVILDGRVMWSEGEARPYASLTHKCPEGDVTGAEIAACTLWEGVVYALDDTGNIVLIPTEGTNAPQNLLFPDLGPVQKLSSVYDGDGFTKIPWDVFTLQGCQE